MGLFAGTQWDVPVRCDTCGKPLNQCGCPPTPPLPPQWLAPQQQTARVRVETRKGKRRVTVVTGLSPTESDLPELLAKLKSTCAAGGSREGDDLVLQGDHRERVVDALRQIGYRAK